MKLILVRNDFQLCPRSLTLCLPCCCESRGTVPHRRLESRKFNFFFATFLCSPSLLQKKGLCVVKPQVVDDALVACRHVVLYVFALSPGGVGVLGFRPSQVHWRPQWMNMEWYCSAFLFFSMGHFEKGLHSFPLILFSIQRLCWNNVFLWKDWRMPPDWEGTEGLSLTDNDGFNRRMVKLKV